MGDGGLDHEHAREREDQTAQGCSYYAEPHNDAAGAAVNSVMVVISAVSSPLPSPSRPGTSLDHADQRGLIFIHSLAGGGGINRRLPRLPLILGLTRTDR